MEILGYLQTKSGPLWYSCNDVSATFVRHLKLSLAKPFGQCSLCQHCGCQSCVSGMWRQQTTGLDFYVNVSPFPAQVLYNPAHFCLSVSLVWMQPDSADTPNLTTTHQTTERPVYTVVSHFDLVFLVLLSNHGHICLFFCVGEHEWACSITQTKYS